MKLFKRAADVAKKTFIGAVEAIGTAEVEKRDGVFVARYLDPMNAKKWFDWGTRYGIPGLLPAAEMHVTVIYSMVDVKLARSELPIVIDTASTYGGSGVFCLMGPNNESLVYAFSNWSLYDRHYEFLSNGAVTSWPTYRPHLTLTNSVGDYELSDEALADVPRYIILGPEVNADINKPDLSEENQDGDEEAEGEDECLIIVIDIAKAAAKGLLEADKEKHELNAMDAFALADVSKGRVTRSVAKRLAAIEGMPEAITALKSAQPKKERVLKSVDLKISMEGAFTAEIQKATKREDSVFKTDEDRRLVWSIASVSTVKGEKYFDVDEEHFSTRALEEFAIQLTKSGGFGKFEHEGEDCNRIVQALVLSDEVQKALNRVAEQYGGSCDLRFEPMAICTEVHPDRWDEVKKGGFRDSIAGTFYYYEDEDDADA